MCLIFLFYFNSGMHVSALFTSFFLASAAFVSANPKLQDIHQTKVTIEQDKSNDFTINLVRVDDVVDVKEDGAVEEMAVRATQVRLAFSLNPITKKVTLNSRLLPFGVSKLNVAVEVVKGYKEGASKSHDEIDAAFDKGIVGLHVVITSQQIILPTGLAVDRMFFQPYFIQASLSRNKSPN